MTPTARRPCAVHVYRSCHSGRPGPEASHRPPGPTSNTGVGEPGSCSAVPASGRSSSTGGSGTFAWRSGLARRGPSVCDAPIITFGMDQLVQTGEHRVQRIGRTPRQRIRLGQLLGRRCLSGVPQQTSGLEGEVRGAHGLSGFLGGVPRRRRRCVGGAALQRPGGFFGLSMNGLPGDVVGSESVRYGIRRDSCTLKGDLRFLSPCLFGPRSSPPHQKDDQERGGSDDQ